MPFSLLSTSYRVCASRPFSRSTTCRGRSRGLARRGRLMTPSPSVMFPSRSASASLWSRMKRLPSISFSANCWRIWTEQNRKTDKRTGQTGLCAFSVIGDSVFRSGRLPIQPGCLLRRDRERSRRRFHRPVHQ